MAVRMTDQLSKPIIIDTDPGQDDAIAVLFALAAHNQLDVLGITAVAGNVPLNLTSRNARIILDWANRSDVPVFAGCPRPSVRELITAAQIHGTGGLGGVPLHEPRTGLGKLHRRPFSRRICRRRCGSCGASHLDTQLEQAPGNQTIGTIGSHGRL